MKYTAGILLSTAIILAVYSTNFVNAYTPSNSDMALLEATLDLEISRCEFETDETKLKECDSKIMEYVNLLCGAYGSLESGKCERAEQYFIERNNLK